MMLFLRIRKAEVALADGRLEDAYQEALREDVQNHRRGQRLITRLSKALEQRGQSHLSAGDARDALADVDRAIRLAGHQPSLVALQNNAAATLQSEQRKTQRQHAQLDQVRQHLRSGDFARGQALCSSLDNDQTTVAELKRLADQAAETAEKSLLQMRQAIKQADWQLAIDAWRDMQRLGANYPPTREAASQLARDAADQIRGWLRDGKLDQAQMLADQLGSLSTEHLELATARTTLQQCELAIRAIDSGRWGEAAEQLKSLESRLPSSRWLSDAIGQTRSAAESASNLKSGPLGLLRRTSPASASPMARPAGLAKPSFPKHGLPPGGSPNGSPQVEFYDERQPVDAVRPVVGRPIAGPEVGWRAQGAGGAMADDPAFDLGDSLSKPFLIHLDGAGSFVVVPQSRIRIGPPSRSQPVDIPIVGKLHLPTLTIERIDDEYFASASESFVFQGRPTHRALLSHGDDLELAPGATLRFTKPCAASSSAVLDFRGIRPQAGSARRVILMEDSLIVGPQRAAHIKAVSLERPLVLHRLAGGLQLRPLSDAAQEASKIIHLNHPQDIGGLSFVVAPFHPVA